LQDFFLVVDTETSGLPKNWSCPYSKEKNWPYIVQIAWIIYDKHYQEVKRENHYIKNTDFTIDKASLKIHNITEEYLQAYGEDKQEVMLKFYADLVSYKPLIIGHFIEFDYHMVNAEFYRIGKENVLENVPLFCTMKASAPYVVNPIVSELKLNQFYVVLFNQEPKDSHNALSDALNTAKIFFYLLLKGEVNVTSIHRQGNINIAKTKKEKPKIFNIKNIFFQLASTLFYG